MLMSGCRDYVDITAADVSYVVCNDRNDRSGSGKVIHHSAAGGRPTDHDVLES
jgi:hypothetical protein